MKINAHSSPDDPKKLVFTDPKGNVIENLHQVSGGDVRITDSTIEAVCIVRIDRTVAPDTTPAKKGKEKLKDEDKSDAPTDLES
ncbi:hypothetical protein [Parasphaerochaeta coccoides]|uniref:Uncharacterized protein n=1 Tax=Parasphaerochaeta coccoides (strain ATCC BAA-1237 / DSM 17374 / SPN1) TaxID=760011 RepID=F4GHD4_PARC1|nr:hypothetical protein [Parasphaerochaeta coccoides]AEC02033.1 hypothetical protein Spico_0808 [Parasphaerochaeta coccoides DSM 17374]